MCKQYYYIMENEAEKLIKTALQKQRSRKQLWHSGRFTHGLQQNTNVKFKHCTAATSVYWDRSSCAHVKRDHTCGSLFFKKCLRKYDAVTS